MKLQTSFSVPRENMGDIGRKHEAVKRGMTAIASCPARRDQAPAVSLGRQVARRHCPRRRGGGVQRSPAHACTAPGAGARAQSGSGCDGPRSRCRC